MSRFHFRGSIPASKSILNRLLIVQSFAPSMTIVGDSDADDVVKMRAGLKHILRGEPADCGAAGTTLRFLSVRASRLPGTHHLSGSLRLFERPQTEVSRLLTQLDCEAEIRLQRLTVRGQGWQEPDGEIVIDRSVSSQFASAVFLSAWDLPFDLRVRSSGPSVSQSYLSMTLEICRHAGMRVEELKDHASSGGPDDASDNVYLIPAGQKVSATLALAEPDASSAFAVAATGVARSGIVELENWPRQSLQPDAIFPELLERMGCRVDVVADGGAGSAGTNAILRIERVEGSELQPLEYDLRDAPDLFPVLAVLCSLAGGRSRLFGAPHLAHKESNRIGKTAELIKALGRKAKVLPDGLEIEGRADGKFPARFKFATDHDHRLAMAAAVAQAAGAELEILEPKVVDKSFPGFWQAIESGSST